MEGLGLPEPPVWAASEVAKTVSTIVFVDVVRIVVTEELVTAPVLPEGTVLLPMGYGAPDTAEEMGL